MQYNLGSIPLPYRGYQLLCAINAWFCKVVIIKMACCSGVVKGIRSSRRARRC
jgi:hypothetical protein